MTDGLSIPFFSLGKRVHSISRTWSRHTSLEPTGTPEWATQVGRIVRPEDIVINRDPADLEKLERGEIELPKGVRMSSLPSTAGSGGSRSGTLDEKKERNGEEIEMDGVTERDNELEKQPGGEGNVVGEDREDSGDSVIPDREQIAGDETEWREGHDLIIERKVANGEEVCDEPFPNLFVQYTDCGLSICHSGRSRSYP